MKDSMKNKILTVAVVLTIGACLMAISATRSSAKVQEILDQERYSRMTAEEKLEKASAKLTSLQSQLNDANNKIQGIQAVLDQGRSSNADLKAQLESVTKLKASLERKIEELKNAQVPVPAMPANPPVKTK